MSIQHDIEHWRFRKITINPKIRWQIIVYFSIVNIFDSKMCHGIPITIMPSALKGSSLLEVALKRVTETNRINNLTRQHEGDIFTAYDMPICNADTCIGLSSGTAGLYKSDDVITKIKKKTEKHSSDCRCQCMSHLNTFREDLNICVDDINECTLAPFISGSSSEKIPFVILPLRGQIIHPSKEINFRGVKAPICAVAGSQYLTSTGWTELRNPIDTDVPFRLFRDEGRTFLQWLGESDLRYKMQGRLILVHLMCRDMAPHPIDDTGLDENATTGQHIMNNQNMFSPCVAFRVIGTPIKHINNVTEVSFQSEITNDSPIETEGLTTKEYIVIGICSLLLGLIYVASVFLYLHVKKRKSRNSSNRMTQSSPGVSKNDQVTFNSNFNQTGGGNVYASQSTRSEIHGGGRIGTNSTNPGGLKYTNMSAGEELGIIKNNPLLKHYPNLGDNAGFVSDLSNSASECDEEHPEINKLSPRIRTPELLGRRNIISDDQGYTQETECLPEENVSIVEDMNSDDKLENMKAIVNGTVRRKLYFNPAYFEPQLLLSPPPAAIEFLTKIREVITIAKYKMSSKRFQPSLIMIPEEYALNGSDTYTTGKTMSISHAGSYSRSLSNSRKLTCSGCPGCADATIAGAGTKITKIDGTSSNCKNCGDKRNSIRKWLEDVSHHENDRLSDPDNEHNILDKDNGDCLATSNCTEKEKSHKKIASDSCSLSSGSDTLKANSTGSRSSTPKRKVPPALPKTDPPKIISHFLKKDVSKQIDSIPSLLNKIETSTRDNRNDLYMKNSVQSLVESNKIYDKTEIYNQLSKVGSELYNNPQFEFCNSPQQVHRGSNKKKSIKPHLSLEVLDQFSDPQKTRHYEAMKSLQQMPDMVYEAMARDLNKKHQKYHQHYGQINVPTPDYDDPYTKTPPHPYVDLPPPDYNTLGRSKPHYQPDSPIYTRKSPHFLIVDYETDSLERSASKKENRNSSSSPPSNNSDLSSQPSPSLSAALPLEEELEVRNTIYDRVEGFRKDCGDLKKFSKDMPIEPRIKYDTPFQGSMTIEVEHVPTDCELSTDSEQFEPDTLDRKPKKLNNESYKNSKEGGGRDEWIRNYANKPGDRSSFASLPNVTDQIANNIGSQLVLKSNGSFKSNSLSNFGDQQQGNGQKNFGSLREIYEAKTQKMQTPAKELSSFEKGRLLTLEARHSKRQRKTNPDSTLKKPMPPDVIPAENNIYDSPNSGNRIEGLVIQKNLTGWNTDDADTRHRQQDHYDQDTCDTTSSNSESTEITGVSDTQINSEFESEMQNFAKNLNVSQATSKFSNINNKLSKFHINNSIKMNQKGQKGSSADHNEPIKILETFMTLGDIRNKHFLDQENSKLTDECKTANTDKMDDLNKIETLSTKSLSNNNLTTINNSRTSLLQDLTSSDIRPFDPNINRMMPTKVFRVDVDPPSHGMQIALGLKDRVKKSKDLKNAWKKFVNLAASKFHTNSKSDSKTDLDCLERNSGLSDGDEGCSSMHDDITISDKGISNISRTPSHASDCMMGRQARSDPDCGYMSADSNEFRNKKLYERFNFKTQKTSSLENNLPSNNNANRMQDIKENTESEKSSPRLSQQTTSKMDFKDVRQDLAEINRHPKSLMEPIEINVYSSDDDERFSSEISSDMEEDCINDDICESGAESVETHSVFFKNIRNIEKK